jgi:hypothetical protein
MEQYYGEFVTTLKSFILELNTFNQQTSNSNDGITKFIKVFDKLDMTKVIARFHSISNKYSKLIQSKDEKLFSLNYSVFPGINLTAIWEKINNDQKERVWTYIQMLFLSSSFIMKLGTGNCPNEEEQISINIIADSIKNPNMKPLAFNPYEGIGEVNDSQYGVDEMYNNIKSIPAETNSGSGMQGIGSMANMLGLGNTFDLNKISEQLKSISKEDVDNATDNIKKLLGNDCDDNTGEMISDMLTNITDKLKDDNLTEGNPIDNIVKIAQSVAQQMIPQMNQKGIDIAKLWNSTQKVATNCKDSKGNFLFPEGNNPLTMLSSLVNNQMGQMANQMNANNGSNGSNAKSDNDCYEECKKMFEQVGMKDVDLNKLKDLNMTDLMNEINSKSQNLTNSTNSVNSSKSNKKKSGKKMR